MAISSAKKAAIHPGEILADYLEEHKLSQSEAARRLKVPIGNINEICRGKRGISPEMAVKLAKLFHTTPQLWMNLQQNWDLSRVDDNIAHGITPLRMRA